MSREMDEQLISYLWVAFGWKASSVYPSEDICGCSWWWTSFSITLLEEWLPTLNSCQLIWAKAYLTHY